METKVKRKPPVKTTTNITRKVTPKTTISAKPDAVLFIRNNKDYEKIIAEIDALIEIPNSKLTKAQAAELHRLAKAAQLYEKSVYTIKPPYF